MTGEGVFFVTRMKTNTVYAVEEECEVPEKGKVRRDQIISLPALRKAGEEPVLFRRIEYWNEDKREILVFFTNLLHLAASTIAAIYKDRWKVELFFGFVRKTRGLIRARAVCQVSDRARVRGSGRCGTSKIFG